MALDTVLLLFRKDLRLDDNPALLAALQSGQRVVPVFIWAPEEEGQFMPGRCSRWWFRESLTSLAQQVAALGSRLIVRRCTDSCQELLRLVQETSAQAVFFNHLHDPISLVRDHAMKHELTAAGVMCRSYNADLLFEPWQVLDEAGEPFTTFDGFWGRFQSLPQQPPFPFPPPAAMPAVDPALASRPLDEVDWFVNREQQEASKQLEEQWSPGSAGGLQQLSSFLESRLAAFSHLKANVDASITSRLSPWIHDGSISVRFIYWRVHAQQAEWQAAGVEHQKSCQDFIQQLAYREYSRYLSFHFPFIHERSLLVHLRGVPWNLDTAAFKAWRMGMTGYPLVDAGMKALWSSGWQHNRLRLVCGSFAVKQLLLPWQWGLKHFWDSFLDADLESDALGWQYVSGGMSDAPAFGSLMDITSEAAAFDPDGEFVRRWLPALARLPTRHLHAPWEAPPEVLEAADVELGVNYPWPIITKEEAAARLAAAAASVELGTRGAGTSTPADNPQQTQQQQPQQQGGLHHQHQRRQRQDPEPGDASDSDGGSSSHPAGTGQQQQEELQQQQQQQQQDTRQQQQGQDRPAAGGGTAASDALLPEHQQEEQPPRSVVTHARPGEAAAAAAGPLISAPACDADDDAAVPQSHANTAAQQQQWQQWQQHQARRRRPRHRERHWHAGGGWDSTGQYCDLSEVVSNTMMASEAMPTACSGVVVQQGTREEREEQPVDSSRRRRRSCSYTSGGEQPEQPEQQQQKNGGCDESDEDHAVPQCCH